MGASTILLATLGFASIGSTQSSVEIFKTVVAKDAAYCAMPLKLVLGQTVKSYSVSTTGKFLLAVVENRDFDELPVPYLNREPEERLVLCDIEKGTSSRVNLPKNTQFEFSDIQWFGRSNSALVSVSWQEAETNAQPPDGSSSVTTVSRHRRFLLSAETGSMLDVALTPEPGRQWAEVVVSPTAPMALVILKETNAQSQTIVGASVLGANGSFSRTLAFPESAMDVRLRMWRKDGNALFADFYLKTESKPELRRGVIDLKAGTWRFSDEEPADTDKETPTITLESRQLKQPPAKSGAMSWWLVSDYKSNEPEALLVAHADNAELTQDEGHAIFLIEGALFISKIHKLTLEEYLNQIVKPRAMQTAKQCALAFLMYAADNNDTIPDRLNVMKELTQYVGKEDLLRDFVYTFPGGSLGDISDPANTQIGYIETVYGRAVAYADGHVGWKDPA